jgi:hypothetical protein
MARARAINPYFISSQSGRTCAELAGGALAWPLALRSGAFLETFGSDGEKSSSGKALVVVAKYSRAILELLKRSGRIAQVLASVCSSPAFGSDS